MRCGRSIVPVCLRKRNKPPSVYVCALAHMLASALSSTVHEHTAYPPYTLTHLLVEPVETVNNRKEQTKTTGFNWIPTIGTVSALLQVVQRRSWNLLVEPMHLWSVHASLCLRWHSLFLWCFQGCDRKCIRHEMLQL